MTEPAQPPDQPPAPKREIVRIRWHRISVYAGSIALIIAMWICATLYVIREHPDRFVHALLARLPVPSSTGKVFWVNRRTLEIDDVKLGKDQGAFFYADSVIVTASPWGLLRRHVAKVQINGGQVFTKTLYAAMDSVQGGDGQGLDWTIGRLEINRGTLILDNFATDLLPAIPVSLGARYPIVLHNLNLGAPDESPDMTKEQKVEIVNVKISSPFDAFVPVLAFPLTQVRFTYTELWHHHIREVDLVRPTLFLGEDLFWFTDAVKKMRATLPAQGPTSPWEISHLEVQYGQLAVNAFGQPVVRFPFFFETKVDDIRLDQLDKISAKSTIAIKRLDQDYPDYKIRLTDLEGRLYFSLPPTDDTANNVVNTISIQELSWNDIPVTDVNSTVTFDPDGVYGKLNGTCGGGQMTGNFEFYYTKGFSWNADFFADKINCQPIAEKLGGKYFDMTGEMDGDIAVQGKATVIQKCEGILTLPHPGVLKIKSLEDLMNRLPANASSLKKDFTRIAIQTFETYPYLNGRLKIDYTPEGGAGVLNLESPNGRRQFEMYWHPGDDSPKTSKVAKDADNR